MIFNAPNTPRNRIAALIAIALGLCVGLYMSLSDKGDSRDILEISDSAPAPDQPSPPDIEGGVPQELSDIRQPSDIDFAAYDRDMAQWLGLEIGMPMEAAELKVIKVMGPEQGGEGNAVFEMDKFEGYVGGKAFVATIDRLADDSVRAQQLYAIGKKSDGEAYTLVDYGMRVKCWRGENTDTWQKTLCP